MAAHRQDLRWLAPHVPERWQSRMVEQLRIVFPTDVVDEERSERVFAPLLRIKHKAVSVRSSRR